MTSSAAPYAYATTALPERKRFQSDARAAGFDEARRVASQGGGAGASSSRIDISVSAAAVQPAHRER